MAEQNYGGDQIQILKGLEAVRGGTGAFIDEIATLLGVKTEEFESLAAKGTTVYDISGRCGVFAKTDIQPLLIQGADRADIALSTFHAIAKQTIGGLSQGLELKAPIIFEGGPLTFNSTLIRVFAERLGLSDKDYIVPQHAETIVAYGTAVAIDNLFDDDTYVTIDELINRIDTFDRNVNTIPSTGDSICWIILPSIGSIMSPMASPIWILPHELIDGTNIPLSFAVRKLTSPSVEIIGSLTAILLSASGISHIPRLLIRLNIPSISCWLYSLLILLPTPISATSVGTPR